MTEIANFAALLHSFSEIRNGTQRFALRRVAT